jgi:farnesyl-diphosphate farnesyltransferase
MPWIIKNQSVFNFCAIPATMAIATLELCFMNPAMFQRNIKIRKLLLLRCVFFFTSFLHPSYLLPRSL